MVNSIVGFRGGLCWFLILWLVLVVAESLKGDVS